MINNIIFLLFIILIPGISVVLLKLFFTSAMLFNFRNRNDLIQYGINGQKLNDDDIFMAYSQPEYQDIIDEIKYQLLDDQYQLYKNNSLSSYQPERFNFQLLNEQEYNQIVYKSLIDKFSQQENIDKYELLQIFNITQEEYDSISNQSILFYIQFNESNDYIRYNISYNSTLYDNLNFIKNDTYEFFTFIQKYRNPLGPMLTQYINNAIMKFLGYEEINVEMQMYPNKQFTVNDTSTVDHAVLQLCMSIFCVCCCVYICKDRGTKSDQYALRLLGNSEICYQIVRLFSSLIVMLLSGCCLGIAAKFSNCVPFDKMGIPSSIIVGICLTLPLCSMILLISTLFGSNGAINPIIIILIISLLSNFITEIAFYLCLGARNYKDYSVVPKGLYYFLVFLPNVNGINILDLAKINTQNLDTTKASISQSLGQTEQILCNNQDNISQIKYYQVDNFGILCLYNVGSFIIYSILSIIIAYCKPEPYYPGINPFKLLFSKIDLNRNQQLELKHMDIIYKQWRKKTIAVHDLNISFQQIQLGQNIDQVKLGLLGCSGSGKSSTMGVLTGQIRPQGEQCVLLGYDLKNKLTLYKVRQEISYCPQLNENVISCLTMKQNIKFSQFVGNSRIKVDNEYINQQLQQLDLPIYDIQIKNLSGGMLRRLSLINSLIQNKQFYVFDEITSGIDSYNAELIDKKIQSLQCSYILSTHDMYEVEKLCNYVIIMKYGQTKLDGTVNQIKFNNQITSISIKQQFDQQQKQIINDIFTQQNCILRINSPTTLKYELNDNRQINQIIHQLEVNNINDYTINRSDLNDIFIKYASVEDEEDNQLNQQQIDKPLLSNRHRILAMVKLFQVNDLRNKVLLLPCSILFLIIIIAGCIIAYLISLFCGDYINYMYNNYIDAYQLSQGQECLICCGFDQQQEGQSIEDMFNMLQQCDPQCYSSSSGSPYIQGSCVNFLMMQGLPILDPPIKNYYGDEVYKSENVGFYNSQEQRFWVDNAQISQTQKIQNKKEEEYPKYDKLRCYECESICQMRCLEEECLEQCYEILYDKQVDNINCSMKCNDIDENNIPIDVYISDSIWPSSFAYEAQKKKLFLNQSILNGKNDNKIINEQIQDWVPLSIIQQQSNRSYILSSYYPSIRGSISVYGDFKIQIQAQDYNITEVQLNQNPYDQQFWNLNEYILTLYNKTESGRKAIYSNEKTTELADANGISLISFPFDMYNYELTQIFNSEIQKQNTRLQGPYSYEIQYSSQAQPYFPYFHESTTFVTYLAIVQCVIISILFETPMIMSSITFTELKTTKIFTLLKLHGVQKFHIIFGYLLFQIIIIISASIITLILSLCLSVEQAIQHPLLFILYLMEISFSSLIFGIIISLISNDKRKSALISSIFVLLSMFLTVFLTHNSFLICFVPQLFSMWRLQYLGHVTAYEWLNLLVPFSETLILLVLLFQLSDKQNNEKLHIISEDNIFEYNEHNIHIYNKLTSLKEQYSTDYDLIVQNFSLNIGHKEILYNINFNVKCQQIFALLGLSGSGKSVTLKTLTKQLKPTQGKIILNQQNKMRNINNIHTNIISYVPQIDILPLNYTLNDIYSIFKLIHGHKNRVFIDQAQNALNLQHHKEFQCQQLSGGQKRRLSLLISLLQSETNIIAFDEVTTGQSPDLKQIILNLITQTNQNFGKTCIITTHYLDEIISIANQFVLLNEGKLVLQNDVNKIYRKNQISIMVGKNFVSKLHSEKDKNIFVEGQIILFNKYKWKDVTQYLQEHNITSWITINDNPSDSFLSMYKGIKMISQ